MKLLEFLDQRDINTAYYDPTQDDVGIRHINDKRKPSLTLMHLNRLNKIRTLRQLEDAKRSDLLTTMYATPDESEMGGGMGGGPF